MKKAIAIHPNGITEVINLDPSTELSQLQTAVGGYVQAVYPNRNTTLWCNEDGKFLALPVNRGATVLWHELQPAATDTLHGVVVVTGGADGEGDTLAVDPETESIIGTL